MKIPKIILYDDNNHLDESIMMYDTINYEENRCIVHASPPPLVLEGGGVVWCGVENT
jgi:hypothetical protein